MSKTKTEKRVFATHITSPAGKRIYLRAGSKEELEQKKLEAKIAMRAGVDLTDETTFADYARLWLVAYKKKTLRPASYITLETQLEGHVIPFFGDVRVKDVKPLMIQAFLNEIAPYSKSLKDKCFGLVKSIFAAAVDDGLILRTPVRADMKIVPSPSKEEEPLTDEQARRLLDAVNGSRAYTFCLIALSTGMRRGEILALKWENVDFDENVIRVRHNKSFTMKDGDAPVTELLKTEAARRDLPMSPLLREHLLSVRDKSPFVLHMENGKSLSKSAFRTVWKNIDRRTAGKGDVPRQLGESYGGVRVTLDFDVHPHLLRHTFITKLFEEGLDIKQVQYLAGHSTPEMTMKVYTHYRAKQRAAGTHEQVCSALNFLAAPAV